MHIAADQFNRKPGPVFREAVKGETITIKHDHHPDYMFEMFARKKNFKEGGGKTNITSIAERALNGVDVNFATGGPIPGSYTTYALMVAAEIFRQVMHTTSNNMTRGNIFQIAHEIERAKE